MTYYDPYDEVNLLGTVVANIFHPSRDIDLTHVQSVYGIGNSAQIADPIGFPQTIPQLFYF